MRCRMQRLHIAFAFHHIGGGTHRTGDQRQPTLVRIHRTLAGQPHRVAGVLFPLRVVVVAVNALHFLHIGAHKLGQAGAKPVHHFLPIEERKPLRPVQILDIAPEFWGALHQVGEVVIFDGNPPLRH